MFEALEQVFLASIGVAHAGRSLVGLLDGKVAVVTGAGRGIGRAVAVGMAVEGAALGLAARSAPEIESAAEEIRSRGGRAVAVPTDVGRQEDVDALFTRVRDELGQVDILVANAAIAGPFGKLWETDPNMWQQVLNVNVIGLARCAHAVLPSMTARRCGKIIIVGSMAGRSDAWASNCHKQMAYGTSKAAVSRFSQLLAAQVREHGINVNCVGVAADTRLGEDTIPLEEKPVEERVLPEENVAPFVFLASSLADHVTGAYFEANALPNVLRRHGIIEASTLDEGTAR